MENQSNHSYPESRDSSPRSREIEQENASWDEPPPSTTSYKVKFMCSYGGKIQPRHHDNQLAYIGGDTKILSVDRNIKLSSFVSKLSSVYSDSEVCFKYQLPGEDLDALISVTNDEDLEHMMLEFDRLYRSSAKPARLRLFLFPLNPPPNCVSNETNSDRQWFVDALNSVQTQSLEGSSPSSAPAAMSSAGNPDFLFGFDKGYSSIPCAKSVDLVAPPTVSDSSAKDISAGSDCRAEDQNVVEEPVVIPAEIHNQINDLQKLHISSNEQTMFQTNSDEIGNPKAYSGDYFSQKVPETQPPAPAPALVPMPVPPTYITTGGYSFSGAPTGTEQPVYLIQTQSGMYQVVPAIRQATGPVGQAYYGVQRMVPEISQVYNATIPQQQNVGAYTEGVQVKPGFAQVGYDSAGRQVYYTTQGCVVSSYQKMVSVPGGDGRQGGGVPLNQETGKVVATANSAKVSQQASAV